MYTPYCTSPLRTEGRLFINLRTLEEYQTIYILLDNPNVTLKAASTLNPAMLLPTSSEEHVPDYIHIIEQVYLSCPSLRGLPLENPDLELFTVESIFMDQGQHKVRYVMVTHQ